MKRIDLQTIDDRVDPLYFDESRKYKYINDDYEKFEKSKKDLLINYNAWRELSQHLIPHYNLIYLDENIINEQESTEQIMNNQIQRQMKIQTNKRINDRSRCNKHALNKLGISGKKRLFSTMSDLSKRIISDEETDIEPKIFINKKLDLSKILVDCIHAYDQGTRDFSELSKKLKTSKKEINKVQDLMICNLNNNIEDMKIGLY